MKKLTLLLLLYLPIITYSQDKIPTLLFGEVPPTVVELDGVSQAEIYDRLINWVNNYYRSPDDVLKVNNSEQVRLRALDKCFFQGIALGKVCYTVYYNLTIDIKENKYRFSFDIDKIMVDATTPALFGFKAYYKKDGSVRKGKGPQLAVSTANESLKNLHTSIYSAITGTASKNNDDW